MKISLYLAEIVSEFAGFHHTPDFKCSRSTGEFELSSPKSSGKSSRRSSTESKHSINIPVGVNDLPTVIPSEHPPRSTSPHFVKHVHSSPSVSRMASLSSLQEKLQKRRSASTTSTSYRVMM